MKFRIPTLIAAMAAVLVAALGLAGPAQAVTIDQKLSTLAGWTGTAAGSYNAWNTARTDRTPWTGYGFDWSTDYCSSSPDNPLGFDFRLSCHRHDFGYRNYKAMSLFSANKGRLDSAFYQDMLRRCDGYASAVRPACDSLAWTYYQAVRAFGSISVSEADLNRARDLLPAG